MLGLPGGSDGKKSACVAGDLGLIPGSGRSTGERNGYPLYSILSWKIPTDRGAWRATSHRVSKTQTRLNAFRFFSASGFSVWLCVFLMQTKIHNEGERDTHSADRGQGHLQLLRSRLAMYCMVPRAKSPRSLLPVALPPSSQTTASGCTGTQGQ